MKYNREVPKKSDELFYNYTKSLKEESKTAPNGFKFYLKSSLAFSFVLALFIYNINFKTSKPLTSFYEDDILFVDEVYSELLAESSSDHEELDWSYFDEEVSI